MNEHEEWVAAMKTHIMECMAGIMTRDRPMGLKALEDLLELVDGR